MGANKSAGGGQVVYNYVYDRYGNRWQQNGPHTMLETFSGNNNRMDGYSYDAAGNLLNDGTHAYTYDAENRIISVDNGSTATYVYDAEGNRATKTNSSPINSGGGAPDPSGTTALVYDLQGRLVAIESPSVNPPGGTGWISEVYAGSRHLATYTGNASFTHADWLGTIRHRDFVYLNSGGLIQQNISSLPFGDWGATINSWDPLNFTGQFRDFESGLDNFGARFNASTLGRFMSPDPENAGASLGAPQSWNAYSYVLNNPLKYVDPFGLDCVYTQADGSVKILQGDCASETDDGYYVDGTIRGAFYNRWVNPQSAGITLTEDGNFMGYSYRPYDSPFTTPDYQCIGDCSHSAFVSSPVPPTSQIGDSGYYDPFGTRPVYWTPKYTPPQTLLGKIGVLIACGGGTPGDAMGAPPPIPFNNAAAKQQYMNDNFKPPSESTKETEGQRGVSGPGKNGRPRRYNPRGAEKMDKVTSFAEYANNGNECFANANTPQ